MAKFASGLTLEELERETGKLASDLAFYARRPVNIQMVAGRHIAFTYGTDQLKKPIPVVMNPQTLEKVRNKERALKIWRGIGFHELAHHLWPADPQYKAAYKGNFGHLFNLVDDEQNERRGRALDASWGACFQSVCAHIFPSKNRQTVSTGIADGGAEERKPVGMEANEIYSKRWGIFAYHFRRHVPDCQDKVVAEALNLIPGNFKDLSKEELFELTQQIHLTLAKGIEMPEVVEPEPQEPEEEPKKAPEPKPEDKEEEKEQPAPPPATWSIKRLLKNKWMYLPFGLFLGIWAYLFMQKGVDFWVQVAIFGGIAFLAVTAFLFMRRAMIKARLKAIAEALKGGSGPPPPGSRGRMVLTIGVLSLLLALTVVLLIKLQVDVEWIYLLGACTMFGGCVYVGNILAKRADSRKEPLSWWMYVLLLPWLAGSLYFMYYVCLRFGLSDMLLYGAMSVLTLVVLGLTLIMFGSGKGNSRYSRESVGERLSRGTAPVYGFLAGVFLAIVAAIWTVIGPTIIAICRFVARVVTGVATFIWDKVVRFASFVWYWMRRAYWKLSPKLQRLWRNPFFRLAMVTMPIAAIGVILYALTVKAISISWWLVALLVLLLLLLLALLYFFRKQISRFILTELFMPMPELMGMFIQPPLDMTTDWFIQIDNIVPVDPDQAVVDELLPETFALASQLRKYLAECGSALVDKEDQPDGHDLIEEAELALIGETNIFVEDERYPRASVHLEVALDCSGSMGSATLSLSPGEKFRLGKLFAMVLEQAIINLPGVSAHFWGFTSDTIFDCGVAGERKISGLKCGGGNNDAAMLYQMGQSARSSGKDVKILLMLSDGQPSECSWLSLRNLVHKFEQEGMIPWNFALDVIKTPAFERFFTDLVGQTQDEAVMTMGQILAAIAQSGNE